MRFYYIKTQHLILQHTQKYERDMGKHLIFNFKRAFEIKNFFFTKQKFH